MNTSVGDKMQGSELIQYLCSFRNPGVDSANASLFIDEPTSGEPPWPYPSGFHFLPLAYSFATVPFLMWTKRGRVSNDAAPVAPRAAFVVLLAFVCATALPQVLNQASSNLPKSFRDDNANITYFFPAHFEPVLSSRNPTWAVGPLACVKTTLSRNSALPAGSSSFVVSTIDSSCPDGLREAAQLGPFTRTQILRQLKQYGEPRITREPTRYTIDGHTAAITLATVSMPAAANETSRALYAAKACALVSMTGKGRGKSEPVALNSHILCFDFSTENSDLFSLMLSFVIQFGDDPPEPIFLGRVYRGR